MECSEARDLIPQYCNGELDDDTRRQVEQHISGCPECHDDIKREQELGRMISKSAADDPPDAYWDDYDEKLRARMQAVVVTMWGIVPGNPTNEYWDDYNGSLRHRIRGAIGALWGAGLMPACLAAALYGLFLGAVGGQLFGHHALRSVHPGWFRITLEVLIYAATIVAVTLVIRSLFPLLNRTVFATRRWMPRYEALMSQKPLTGVNPVYLRTVIGALLMLGYLALCVYTPSLITGMLDNIPRWAVKALRIMMSVAYVGTIPSSYMMMRTFVVTSPEESNRLREWCQRYRKGVRLANALWGLAFLAWMAAGVWNFWNYVTR